MNDMSNLLPQFTIKARADDWPPIRSDHDRLAYARAALVHSGTGLDEVPDLGRLPTTIRVMQHYREQNVKPRIHCRPYDCGDDHLPPGQRRWYIPSWARAGARYLVPGIDLLAIDPAKWFSAYMLIVNANYDSADIDFYLHGDRCLETEFDEIRAALDSGRVLIDAAKIKRAGLTWRRGS
jgi:hypothetical protein